MKLFRYGQTGSEKPAVELADGKLVDVSAFTPDFNESFFESGRLNELAAWLSTEGVNCPEVASTERLGSPIARPSKIVCIGLNYAKHAEETNSPIPKEPIIFFKATSALAGPYDEVVIPRNSVKTDWEVELAVVIGKKTSYVTEAEAMDYVAGYVLHNDYSEREFQIEKGGQWVKGKSADTFAPLGPFLATADEISDPHDLRLWLSVNGKMLQDSNTDDMIFKIPFVISYLSQFMTLLPGDVISTGTPFGVGLGFQPPIYLKEGDVVELGIDQLGTQKQTAVAWKANK